MLVRYQFPKAFAKFIKESEAGNITPDMVEMVPNPLNPQEMNFTVYLQAYDCFGDSTGEVQRVEMSLSKVTREHAEQNASVVTASNDLEMVAQQKANLERILKQIENHKKGKLR